MNQLLRLLVVAVLVMIAVFILAVGLARNDANLLAPLNLLLFVIGVALYLLPAGLAFYRDCRSLAWIAALNILFGWTILGWFVAMGWAASGMVREHTPVAGAPPSHPLPGH